MILNYSPNPGKCFRFLPHHNYNDDPQNDVIEMQNIYIPYALCHKLYMHVIQLIVSQDISLFCVIIKPDM